MNRFFAVAAAAAATLALAPTAGFAQTGRGYYAATPVTAPAAGASIVTRSTVWRCGADGCTAPKAPSRDAIMCELLVKEVGQLSAFTANGAAFDAAALEKCNARAR